MKVELYVPNAVAEKLGHNEAFEALLRHAGGGTLIPATGLWIDKGKIQDEAVGIQQFYTDAEGVKLAYAAVAEMLAAGEEVVLIAIDGEPEFVRA